MPDHNLPDFSNFIPAHIQAMQAYTPGQQPPLHSKIIKLNTNENPFPASPTVYKALKQALKEKRLHLYPDSSSSQLRQAIAKSYGLTPEHVLIGNGSDEILALLLRTIFSDNALKSRKSLLTCDITYSLYAVIAKGLNIQHTEVPLLEKNWHIDFSELLKQIQDTSKQVALTILSNPNAPTSLIESSNELLKFAQVNPALTLIDEAYAPFMGEGLGKHIGEKKYERLLVCGTFSKAYSLAGQRIGWLLAHPELINAFDKLRDSYNVSYLAQVAALAAWEDKATNQKRMAIICQNRDYLQKGLLQLGFSSVEANGNFIFTQPPPDGGTAFEYARFLAQHKLLVRHFLKPERIANYVRISIGKRSQLRYLLKLSKKWISSCK